MYAYNGLPFAINQLKDGHHMQPILILQIFSVVVAESNLQNILKHQLNVNSTCLLAKYLK